jgi:uncharacterized protein YecE (DUF72 family)
MAQAEYYRQFAMVEIQHTFYSLPRVQTALRWRQVAGPGFEFSVKAWQLITHEPNSPTYRRLKTPIPEPQKALYGSFRPTDAVFEAWSRTASVARALEARVVVFQCPARFTSTKQHADNLRGFFRTADRAGFVMAWEPRGDWPPALIRDLCQELDLVHVVDPLKQAPQSGGMRYFRLHGLTGYRYLHTDEDLRAIAVQCAAGAPTYVLFNNLFMAEDALRFRRLLGP